MTDLAALVVRMQADNSQYVAKLQESTNKLEKFQKEQESALDEIGKKFKELAGELAGAFTVDKIVEFIASTLESNASLQKFSQSSGIAVEDLSALSSAAAGAGLSQDELGMAVKKLNVNLSEASGDPTSKSALALKILGISATDASGNVKDAGTVIGEVADKFAGTADGANKTAIAVQLFGKAGEQMIPMLDKGKAGLDAAREAAIAWGAATDGPAAEAAEHFEQTLNALEANVRGGLGSAIQSALLPVLQNMIDAFTNAGPPARQFAAIGQSVAEVVKLLATVALETVSEFTQMGESIGAVAAAAVATAHGRFKEAADIWKQSNADNAATAEKYAKIQMAMYKETADAAMYAANTESALAEKQKAALGSLEGAVKSGAADEELKKFSAGLQEQAGSFGKGEVALVQYKLQVGTLADALKIAGQAGKDAAASALKFAAALQSQKDTKSVDDMTKKMREQIDTYDLGAVAAYKYSLSQGEVGEMFTRMGAAGEVAKNKLIDMKRAEVGDEDIKGVQKLKDEIEALAGSYQHAAKDAFDLQNAALIKNVQASGNADQQKVIDQARQLADAQDQYNKLVEQGRQIKLAYETAEATVHAAVATHQMSELQGELALQDARKTEVAQYGQIVTAEKAVSDANPIQKLKDDTVAANNELKNMTTTVNTLAQATTDKLENAFADAFSKFAEGTESAKKALMDFGKSIENMMMQSISKSIAQSIFGGDGPGSGAGGFLSGIMGSVGGNGQSLFGSIGSSFGNWGGSAAGSVTGAGGALGLSGGGGTASLISDADLPGLAGGGTIGPGGMALVGESGPELAYAGSRNLNIVPMSKSANMGASVTIHNTIQAPDGTISRQTQAQLAGQAGRQVSMALKRRSA
jgi:hypothetical protein